MPFPFITEESAAENLRREGVSEAKIHWVGNTMVDTLLRHRKKAEASTILSRLGLVSSTPGTHQPYSIVTLHRPSNVDRPEVFGEILEALSALAKEITVLFPIHPRTVNRLEEFQRQSHFDFFDEVQPVNSGSSRIQCIPPLGYLDFLWLMSNARLVLTDSGGIQEETTVLGVPCVTLRENTERPVTISSGTNILAGTKKENILRLAFAKLESTARTEPPKYWDGKAGSRIIQVLTSKPILT